MALSLIPTQPKVTPIARKALSKRQAPSPVSGLLTLIQRSLDDDQGEDVVVIDMAGKSAIADFMVIATGRSSRHVASMAEHLRERVKAHTGRPAPVEGLTQADWVLVDAGDVVVHLFRAEVRAFYNLEKMWSRALPDTEDWMVGLVKERADATQPQQIKPKKKSIGKAAVKKPAGKAGAKKPTGKAVTKKPAAKKPATKKPSVKKPSVKKPAAKKPAVKKSAGKAAAPGGKQPTAARRRRTAG